MKRLITGVLVSVADGKVVKKTIINNYKDFQAVIGVDTFTIVTRKIGNKVYDIYADDNGLFVEGNPVSVITYSDGKTVEQIVGSIFILKNRGSRSTSVSDDDVENIFKNTKQYVNFEKAMISPVITATL